MKELEVMMRRQGILAVLLLLLGIGAGGCVQREEGPMVRFELVEYLRPVQESTFVEITGCLRNSAGRHESFHLLFGPRPKYVYGCGKTLLFNDGRREGRIEPGSLPPIEIVNDVSPTAQNMSMGFAMFGGPTLVALVREADGEEWLSMFEPPPPARTKYEKIIVDSETTKFVLRYPGCRYELVFAEPMHILSSMLVRDEETVPPTTSEMVVTKLTFPSSVPDVAFQMEAR